MECNGALEPIAAEQARGNVPESIAEKHDDFQKCPQCGRIFWKGTHYERMRRWVEDVQSSA